MTESRGERREGEWRPTAVQRAALAGGTGELIALLSEPGAEDEWETVDGRTAFQLTGCGAYGELTPTPLILASIRGHTDTVKALLEADLGGDTEEGLGVGGTALIWATYGDHAGTVTALVEGGADMAGFDDFGFSPLHRAANRGHICTGSRLLDLGANPMAVDASTLTPLTEAVQWRNVDFVRMMLEHESVAVLVDNEEAMHQALSFAIRKNSLGIVDLLLEHGGDLNRVNAGGGSPVRTALHYGSPETALHVLARGGEITERDMWACRNLETITALVAVGGLRVTPLMVPCAPNEDVQNFLAEWFVGEHPLQLARNDLRSTLLAARWSHAYANERQQRVGEEQFFPEELVALVCEYALARERDDR